MDYVTEARTTYEDIKKNGLRAHLAENKTVIFSSPEVGKFFHRVGYTTIEKRALEAFLEEDFQPRWFKKPPKRTVFGKLWSRLRGVEKEVQEPLVRLTQAYELVNRTLTHSTRGTKDEWDMYVLIANLLKLAETTESEPRIKVFGYTSLQGLAPASIRRVSLKDLEDLPQINPKLRIL